MNNPNGGLNAWLNDICRKVHFKDSHAEQKNIIKIFNIYNRVQICFTN